jgi:hypothetical protein
MPADIDATLLWPMWLSKELSSSPEEAPRVKVAPFLGRFDRSGRYDDEVLRMGAGMVAARFVCDRYDDGTSGRKPRTMLCEVLISQDEPSEQDARVRDSALLTVDVGDAAQLGAVMVCIGVAVATGFVVDGVGFEVVVAGCSSWEVDEAKGMESAGSGSRLFFSLIEMTIFSRSLGVMWFCWRPRVRCSDESFLLKPGRTMGKVGSSDDDKSSRSLSSDDDDETLDDRAGIGMCRARGIREQTNVSLFHRRQLRFSRRLPSSMTSEILLKTASW